ncbi:MAG: LysR family transcriptional regulator [Myxococcales bacterium]|nr:LysR family transcriptional regulator [Myxococcales bacterium]
MRLQSLRDLEIFKHAVDGGSLRSAARALNLSPAVVSRRIASLEESLEATLLLRSTRSLQVTPRGELFYRRCVAILNQVRDAEGELSPTPEALEGALRVGLPTASAYPGFLRALGTFLDGNPALELELYLTDQLTDPRGAGLDVVIRPGPQPDSTLMSRRLGTVQMQMLAAPAYLAAWGEPATPEDLLNHRCLRFRAARQQDVWRLVSAEGVERDVRVGGNFFCDNSAALGQALYAGLGIGFREAAEARQAIASDRLVAVLPDYRPPEFGIHAVYPRENSGSRSLAAFLDLVSDAVRAPVYP